MTQQAGAGPQQKSKGLMAPFLGLVAGIFLLILSGALFVYAQIYGPGPAAAQGDATEVTFVHGVGLNGMAHQLEKEHVIRSSLVFRVAARVFGHSRVIHAGTYQFASGASLISVLDQIEEGKVEQTLITIPEGKTSAQAVRILMATPGLVGDVDVPPEGSILPETYLYTRGETRQAVLDRMLAAGRKTLDELWATRAPGLPFASKEDALILASVVERETGLADERPRVAAVFVNRLRVGMRLESDPTVIYGVSHGEPLGRGLLKSELETKTPWNTYLIDKLPLTPIANPGRAALAAVLNPAPTQDLYFVATGHGGHVFASTYAEHLVNVAKWRAFEANAEAEQASADVAAAEASSAQAAVEASQSASAQISAAVPAPRTVPVLRGGKVT